MLCLIKLVRIQRSFVFMAIMPAMTTAFMTSSTGRRDGYATFGMLVRGQGGSEDTSVTPGGHALGWMTKGILSKDTYYYRGVYLDAVRALEVIQSFPEVDEHRIGVIGGSQGCVSDCGRKFSDIPKVVAADYPYLSNFERAVDVALEHFI